MTRLLAILSLVGFLLAGVPALAEGEADRTSVFHVTGMTCGLCPRAIDKSLYDVEGVRSVEVDRKAERVTVVADATLTTDGLKQTIESAGHFQAELLE